MAPAIENARQVWQRTSLVQRVLLLAILLGCAGAGWLLVGWARKPQMAMLYSQLAADEAGKIVEKIRDEAIPYELADGGTTIKVPVDKVHALRLTMATNGLPIGQEQGYKILDDEKIGSSPFTQRVNYTRAIEGELAKTIRLLEGVSSARVHIVRQEAALFAEQKSNASATVVLLTKPGWRMGASNVAAIVHLVAGSVEGLQPGKVVVVDSKGKLLSGEADDGFAKKVGSFLDYKSQVEEYLATKVEDMLTAVLGPNRASVRVDAVIETSTVSETTENFGPGQGIILKEKMTSSLNTPVETPGEPGAAAKGGGGNKTADEDFTNEYAVNRTVSQKTELPGKIKSLSVAAFVDLSPPEKTEGKEGAAPAAKITVKDVEDIIRNATGLSGTEQTLKVVETTFHRPALAQALQTEEEGSRFTSPDFLLEMARRFSLGILVIGALLTLRILRKPKGKGAGAAAMLALEGQGAAGMTNLLPGMLSEVSPELLRAQITHALQENPEEVKRLFLSWIDSDKGEQ